MTQNGLEILGNFCWWTIRGVRLQRLDLQDALRANGISYELPKRNTRVAFLKAVREVKKSEKKTGVLIRKIKKTAGEYVFGLVDERVDKAAEALGYVHSSTMTFNPNSGSLNCNAPSRVFDAVSENYEKFQGVLDSEDVREIVLTLLQQNWRISVRNRGGIYFVPVSGTEMLASVKAFVEGLGEECAFQVVPQIDVEASRTAIYKSFLEEIKSEISSFREEIDTKGDSKRKQDVMWTSRLESFKTLRDKVSFYADILKFQGEEMLNQIGTLEAEVQEKFLKGD